MSSLRLTRRILSASKLGNDPGLKKLENKLIIYYDFKQKKLDKICPIGHLAKLSVSKILSWAIADNQINFAGQFY